MKREFTTDWVTRKTASWQRVLAPFVGVPNITALEIGCFEGRSACWWLDNILTGNGAVLHCVDPWQPSHLANAGPAAEARFRANTAGYGDRLVVHKMRSFDYAIRELNQPQRPSHSFIYVDGSHEAANVLDDLTLAWPLLVPGGVLICDDYRYPHRRGRNHPRTAIDAFLACRSDWTDLENGYQRIVRKNNSNPSVAAVMVTGHDPRRRPMALHTARLFAQQTYPTAELLIVNQGSELLVSEPIPRVREAMAGRGLVVGSLRNLAWEHVTADLMTCWDDDDVHHPDRISLQVAAFAGRPVALRSELYCHLHGDDELVFTRGSGFENTLLWPRSCRSRYPALPRSSDAHFRKSLKQEYGAIDVLSNSPSLYVRLFHGSNIWPEEHFFQRPRLQATGLGTPSVSVRPSSSEEHELLTRLRTEYRELTP